MKKLLKITLALMMALCLQLTSFNSVHALNNDLSKAGTYQVPIKSLTSAAPIPAVQTAFAKAFGDSLEVTVNEDGKMQAIATLQNMIINLGKEYYANVLTIANGTTLSTKVEKSTQGMGGQTVDVEVPEKILFDLPQLDENNSTVLSITVDFMNAMMGQGNDYPTNVTLTLDLDNVQQLQKEYVLEDGTYNVPVDVLKENSDGQSMAAKAIESAQINVNNNEVTVTLKLKEMTMYGQTASVDKMEYQLKDGTYQEATIIEEENGHPTKVQFKLDQNVKLTNVKFYYGGSNRGATARLSLDLDHLTKVIPSRFNQDGTYSVDVALWNATSDKASMAAAALDSKAKIIVKDGKATMYISTKEMSFGTIKASLQEFYIGSAQEDYKNHSATIIEKDTQGNPTLWSFELPHEDEYINVMMNPHVAMMGNMDLEARIKVDYSTLTYISDKTELETNTKKEDPKENNQNQASNTATENKTETTKDNQQESQAVKTEDGGENIALGDSMVGNIVEGQLLLEQTGGKYYITVGLGLASNVSNVRFKVMTSSGAMSSVSATKTGSSSANGDTVNHYRIQVSSLDIYISPIMYVSPMGRDVQFFIKPNISSAISGTGVYNSQMIPQSQAPTASTENQSSTTTQSSTPTQKAQEETTPEAVENTEAPQATVGTITKESLMENATGLSNHLINSKGKVDRKLKLTIKNIKKKNQKEQKASSHYSLWIIGVLGVIVIGGVVYVKKVKK